jgi:predicted DsbA family dithiol-disulfide isomerase
MERIADRFDAACDDLQQPPVVFHWTPIDLAALLNWNRGGVVPDDRMENVRRVSRELDVPVRIPTTWLDSRAVMAAAVHLEERGDEKALVSWRERVYTAIFEEGRSCNDDDEISSWARDLGLDFDAAAIEQGLDELERRTRAAATAMVTGVPTFMLGEWPMGGIQDDDTMVKLVCRFARRARERGAA